MIGLWWLLFEILSFFLLGVGVNLIEELISTTNTFFLSKFKKVIIAATFKQ